MTNYKCKGCFYNTNHKPNMIKHLNKTFKCHEFPKDQLEADRYIRTKEVKVKESVENADNKCPKCLKTFSGKSNMTRHLKKCKENNTSTQTLINPVITNITNITNNIDNSVNNINININILNPYNKPMITELLGNQIRKCILDTINEHKMNELIPRVFDITYFNESFPENHSIKYPNLKSDKSMVYNGETFVPRSMNLLQDEIIEKVEELVNKQSETMCDGINKEIQRRHDNVYTRKDKTIYKKEFSGIKIYAHHKNKMINEKYKKPEGSKNSHIQSYPAIPEPELLDWPDSDEESKEEKKD